MYTTVINEYASDFYYIDALAGSGVSEYGEGDCFVASPILAARDARHPFTKMYFIEDDRDKNEALEARLDYVFENPDIEVQEPDEYEVIKGDANEEIPNIVSEIWDRSSFDDGFNYFCFIDNQGQDVLWPTIESLTPKPYGDLLINFPGAHAVGLNAVKEESFGRSSDFLGMDLDSTDLPEENVREFFKLRYLDNLSERDRSVQEVVNVYSGVGSYSYDMIYATRDITNGNDYMEVIRYVGRFIEEMDGADVEDMLEIIRGDQATIEEYAPEEDDSIEDSLPEVDEDDGQSDLGDFG
jgi:three-Cys-motif partner protein